ncbi:unnamed protein product [Vitrella brassicaformis CCMP3155]|uniref:Uncharacterized protein n=1 Tax=Vitrella brassicaformis (strain CCMP3155) TaxID=1169540 RepID=A0A0G4FLA8_VITBC|nr:unnamed protein product [Vitrella brassicaformis CCMP3155]|eukprot:CEM14782.1 unnamed protein product [Vitrella brassicaformis CCMP3155]
MPATKHSGRRRVKAGQRDVFDDSGSDASDESFWSCESLSDGDSSVYRFIYEDDGESEDDGISAVIGRLRASWREARMAQRQAAAAHKATSKEEKVTSMVSVALKGTKAHEARVIATRGHPVPVATQGLERTVVSNKPTSRKIKAPAVAMKCTKAHAARVIATRGHPVPDEALGVTKRAKERAVAAENPRRRRARRVSVALKGTRAMEKRMKAVEVQREAITAREKARPTPFRFR